MTSAPPHLGIDAAASTGKITGMIRRLIHGAMRSSMQELISPALTDIKTSLHRVEMRLDSTNERIDAMNESLNGRIDTLNESLGGRIDTANESQGARIDTLTAKIDGVMVQQIQLIKEVAVLHRDKMITTDILSRLGRLEDRMPAKAS